LQNIPNISIPSIPPSPHKVVVIEEEEEGNNPQHQKCSDLELERQFVVGMEGGYADGIEMDRKMNGAMVLMMGLKKLGSSSKKDEDD